MDRPRHFAADAVREHVPLDANSSIRWFEHGYPHRLARWHHHPEVEVHLILTSSGTALVGDAAVAFSPGDLFLRIRSAGCDSPRPGGC